MGAAMGTAVMIAWALFLGPLGLLALTGMAYSMVAQNLALGIICGLLLFSPLALTVVWVPIMAFEALSERRARRATALHRTDAVREPVIGE
jgi:hypothetical protein